MFVRDGVTLFVERPLITLRVEDPILEDALLFLYVDPMKAPVLCCVCVFEVSESDVVERRTESWHGWCERLLGTRCTRWS